LPVIETSLITATVFIDRRVYVGCTEGVHKLSRIDPNDPTCCQTVHILYSLPPSNGPRFYSVWNQRQRRTKLPRPCVYGLPSRYFCYGGGFRHTNGENLLLKSMPERVIWLESKCNILANCNYILQRLLWFFIFAPCRW